VRRWTKGEDVDLLAMAESRRPIAEIAEALDRSIKSVEGRLYRLQRPRTRGAGTRTSAMASALRGLGWTVIEPSPNTDGRLL
jgi:hypothetical protein